MSGMFETWMRKLVSAVMQRENEANVVVVDWLSLAQQLYPDAVNHTHMVGSDIAAMLNWLQVRRHAQSLPLCGICNGKKTLDANVPQGFYNQTQGTFIRNKTEVFSQKPAFTVTGGA